MSRIGLVSTDGGANWASPPDPDAFAKFFDVFAKLFDVFVENGAPNFFEI